MEVSEKEAIDNKWIRPYSIVALWDKWCDYNDIKATYNKEGFLKYNIKEIGKKYLVHERIEGIINILKNGINRNGFNFNGIGDFRGLYFCPRVIVAKRYCEEFNKAGIKSAYLEGKTKSEKREKIFQDFENGKIQLIFNVNLIGEGIHIKGIDLVIMDRPTESFILWNQAKGRQIFNIEGQIYEREGLLIDFVGNSKNEFKKYTYHINQKQYPMGEIKNLIEKSIGIKCFFQPEVIELFEMYEKIKKNSRWFLEEFKDKIIKSYLKGLDMEIIGKKYNTTGGLIRYNLIKWNVPLRSNSLNKEEIINKYLFIKTTLDFIPNARNSREFLVLSHHIRNVWGSVLIFRKEMGERVRKQNKDFESITKKDLIDYYIKVKSKLKREPRQIDLKKYQSHIYTRFFGSLTKFRKSMNIKDVTINKYRNEKEISQILKSSKRDYLDGLNISEIGKKYKIRSQKIRDYLHKNKIIIRKGWHEYKKYTGRRCGAKEYFNKEKLFEMYEKIKKDKNSKIRFKDMVNMFKLDNHVIIRRFGSFKLFKNEAEERAIKLSPYFPEIIISKNPLENNIKIISSYKPKNIIIPVKQNRKGIKKTYEGLHKQEFKSKEDKVDIRDKIISKIQDGDNVLLLESPDLSALKEIEKKGIKPNKIVIPNNLEFKRLAEALKQYKTKLNIECINTSALQYLIDSEEKFDFIWLDYCGAFSYYMKDLDILFQKHLKDMRLILTYNLFDPAKDDENYYFTRVIDYVLDKISGKSKVRLLNDVTYRYKKNMYNIGFDIQDIQKDDKIN